MPAETEVKSGEEVAEAAVKPQAEPEQPLSKSQKKKKKAQEKQQAAEEEERVKAEEATKETEHEAENKEEPGQVEDGVQKIEDAPETNNTASKEEVVDEVQGGKPHDAAAASSEAKDAAALDEATTAEDVKSLEPLKAVVGEQHLAPTAQPDEPYEEVPAASSVPQTEAAAISPVSSSDLRVKELESENTELQHRISDLQEQVSSLQTSITDLETQKSQLQTDSNLLKEAQGHISQLETDLASTKEA
jgi:hypothetical protein